MSKNLTFRYSVQRAPEGEALTFDEMEERFLKQLSETKGKCVKSLTNLAQLYSRSGGHEVASRCVEKLIAQSDDPEDLAAYYLGLGCFREQARDYRGAVGFYRQALALEPGRDQTWYFILNNLAYSLNQLGDFDSAIPYLRRAIDINSRLPNAYKNLGLAYQAKGNLVEAAKLYVAATQANASDPRSLAHLEGLIASHPELEDHVSDLSAQLEACRRAVHFARVQQPDLKATWAADRRNQKRS